jgi:hypothetical protein
MDEKALLERDVQINEKVEGIFLLIESQIVKDSLDNFAQRSDEVAGISKFIEQIDELRQVYTNEEKEFNNNIQVLKREAKLSPNMAEYMKESFRGIIVDLNVYENMLAHMKMNIEGLKERLRDEKNKNLIMDIVEKMRKAYNDYRELNKRVDNELKVLKASIK